MSNYSNPERRIVLLFCDHFLLERGHFGLFCSAVRKDAGVERLSEMMGHRIHVSIHTSQAGGTQRIGGPSHTPLTMWRFGLGNKGDEPPLDGQSAATTASGTTATSAAAGSGHPSSSPRGIFAGGGGPPQDRTPPPAHLNRQVSSGRGNSNNSGRQQ